MRYPIFKKITSMHIFCMPKESENFEKSGKQEFFRRGLARFLDYSLWLTFCALFQWLFALKEEPSLFSFEYLLWIPIETILLSTWGKTLGKSFLKVQLQQGRIEYLSLFSAIRRSFRVWAVGIGMMIPWLLPFSLFSFYLKLRKDNVSHWDYEEGISIFYFPIGISRKFFASLYILIAFYFFSDLFTQIEDILLLIQTHVAQK